MDTEYVSLISPEQVDENSQDTILTNIQQQQQQQLQQQQKQKKRKQQQQTTVKKTNPKPKKAQSTNINLNLKSVVEDLIKETIQKEKNIQNEEEDDEEDNEDDNDDVLKILAKSFSKKGKTNAAAVINQTITFRSDDMLRKCVTPGEIGKYLIKIEITDCKDLKGVPLNRHWTKVGKKAVFLVQNEEDAAYKSVNQIWSEQAKRIINIKDVKKIEYDDDDDDDDKKTSRKRARFSW